MKNSSGCFIKNGLNIECFALAARSGYRRWMKEWIYEKNIYNEWINERARLVFVQNDSPIMQEMKNMWGKWIWNNIFDETDICHEQGHVKLYTLHFSVKAKEKKNTNFKHK